ncbi:MAG: OsmC family protein [Dehalococcoidia bacterium]
MSEERMVNRVRSYTSGTPGRSLNNVRAHHFVIDEPPYAGGPGEEITPADAFLSGVSSCGVLLVESYAQKSGVPLQKAAVTIEGVRNQADPTSFESVSMRFELVGPNQEQAEELVEAYKGR